jgi:hypothetical protein
VSGFSGPAHAVFGPAPPALALPAGTGFAALDVTATSYVRRAS